MNAKLLRFLSVAVIVLSSPLCFGADGQGVDGAAAFDQSSSSSTVRELPSDARNGIVEKLFLSVPTPAAVFLTGVGTLMIAILRRRRML